MIAPAISIILPTFNGSKYLEVAVSSCIRQTFSDWELIIVDDASTDASPKIISRLMQEDRRIRTIRHDSNRKLPAALNTGFANARGRYLTWTSDDNCYRPQALAEMVACLDGNADVGLVFSGYSVIDEKGNEIDRISPGDPDNLHLLNCIGPSFLYRREVGEQVGSYSESLFLVEDYDYWLRTASCFTLRPLHEDLYLFRQHSGSLTQQRRKQISQALERLLVANFAIFESKGNIVALEARLRIVRLAIDNRRPFMAIKQLLCALIGNPGGVGRIAAIRMGLLNQ